MMDLINKYDCRAKYGGATAQIVEFWREHRNEEERKLIKVTPKTCNIWLRNMARKAREIYPSIVPEEMTKKISNNLLNSMVRSPGQKEKKALHRKKKRRLSKA